MRCAQVAEAGVVALHRVASGADPALLSSLGPAMTEARLDLANALVAGGTDAKKVAGLRVQSGRESVTETVRFVLSVGFISSC